MVNKSRILVVDDNAENRAIFRARLEASGYDVLTAADGEAALQLARSESLDLILLDIMMPKVDGIEVCKTLKSDPLTPFVPIILVTAKADPKDVVEGLEAGAEEYLTKPVDQTALVARVKSMLRIKHLHDKTQLQADELAGLNRGLEVRVAETARELERLSQLKRFFSPQLAERIVSSGDDAFLKSHRREIAVLFCDLRAYTTFSAAAGPDQEMVLLRQYHEVVGQLIFEHGATLEHIAGDGVMAFFNDPEPCPDPALAAIRLGVAMRSSVALLLKEWNARGYALGFGVGVSQGYATLGHIGVEGQFHYAAVGPVANLASRLCDLAADGQILFDAPVLEQIVREVDVESIGQVMLKGFQEPIEAYNVN